MRKLGKTDLLTTIFLIAGIGFILQSAGIVDFQSMIGGEKAPGAVSAGMCGIEDVSLIPSSQMMDAAGTQPIVTHKLFLDGIDKGSKSEDSTTSVSTYTDYVIYMGENASNTYYTVKKAGNTDCKDPWNVNADIPAVDTSVTCYLENDDGTLNAATNLSLDSGEATTIYLYCSTTEKYFYGNPTVSQNNVVVISYNSSWFEVPKVVGYNVAAVPQFYTPSFVEKNVSWSRVAYEFPKLTSTKIKIPVLVDAKSGKNPTVTTGGGVGIMGRIGACGMNFTIYDVDYDLDADTLAEIIGIEDEDGTDHMGATGIQAVSLHVS